MSPEARGLLEALREACATRAWSRGVELAREGAVALEERDEESLRVRVRTRGGLVSPLVELFPADEDWLCDCDEAGATGACEHAAAAVIALSRGALESTAPERDASPAEARRILYRLGRDEAGALTLERGVEGAGGTFEAIVAPLAAIASGRAEGPAFAATEADRHAESAMGRFRRGAIPRRLVAPLLEALAACPVRYAGEPARASGEPVLPVAFVEPRGESVRVGLKADPALEETFTNGAARIGGALRPIGDPQLTARERDALPRGVVVPPARIPELVGELLPQLQERVPVEVRARLPGTARVAPRIELDVLREGARVTLLPRIVYGDPPVARIEQDRVVPLGERVPLRDRAAERALATRAAHALGLDELGPLAAEGDEASALAERARESGLALTPRARDETTALAVAGELVAEIAWDGSGPAPRFELAGAAHRGGPSAAAVLAAHRAGRRLVDLPGGGRARLPEGFLARHAPLVAGLVAAREAGRRPALPLIADAAGLAETAGDGAPLPEEARAARARLARVAEPPPVEPPAALRAALRPYQCEGLAWIAALRDAGLGGVLADDMGLGKTVQALAAVQGRTLVVAPTSVLSTWRAEAERFRPDLAISTYHGAGRALDPNADLTITSYALLRLDVDALAEQRFDMLVLDEAQAIKNPDSAVAQAAARLDAGVRLAMTGTPIENRLEELWSQLRVTCPGLLWDRATFAERIERPARRGDVQAFARLRERAGPFVLRRLKRDVARELPPRDEVVLRCDLSEEERAVYEALHAATRRDVVARLDAGAGVMEALEALLRLRQAACHPALVPGSGFPASRPSSKLELLVERLAQIVDEGHKALVFSQWTSLLDLVEPQLAARGLGALRLDGRTRDRATVVRSFQEGGGEGERALLLMTLKAGGVGLTLTAADHVLLLDPWWNPAAEEQAIDRTHRIGQERPVLTHRIVAAGTVEEGILALQDSKRRTARAALEGPGAAEEVGTRSAGLTREELVALLD